MARELKYNNKGYIVDTLYGKETVRKCDSNIAKMKIYEWCYYKVFHWGYYESGLKMLAELGLELLQNLFYFIVNLILLPLSPLLLIIMAHKDIKNSRYEVEKKTKR